MYICTLNGMLVFRSYMYYCGSVCITINNINQIIALYNKTIIDFCFRSICLFAYCFTSRVFVANKSAVVGRVISTLYPYRL